MGINSFDEIGRLHKTCQFCLVVYGEIKDTP